MPKISAGANQLRRSRVSASQHLGHEERELQRLLGVQSGVARRLVATTEIEIGDVLRAAEALGDVLTGQLDMDTTRMRAEAVVDLEEALNLVDDAIEVARLVPGGGFVGVAVHRIALPDDLVAGGLDLLDDRRQQVADLAVAHARDQSQSTRLVGGVETLDIFHRHFRRGARTDLEADRVGDQLGEGDVRAVELTGAVTDPEEVGRQVVELGVVAVVVETQHRALVVQNQGLVAGKDLCLVQARIGDATRVHELQAAVDLGCQLLVACARGRSCDELAVPVVHLVQIGHTGAGERANQVHRGAGVGVCAHQTRRIVRTDCLVGDERIDHVAAVRLEPQRVDVGRTRLGVLAGDASNLDDRHRGTVGEHDGHLQQRADVSLDVRLGVVRKCLGAVTALEQECFTTRDLRETLLQRLDLAGHRDGRHALEHSPHGGRLVSGPRGLLSSGLRECLVELLTQSGRQRREFGQAVDRHVDSPVHLYRIFARPSARHTGSRSQPNRDTSRAPKPESAK